MDIITLLLATLVLVCDVLFAVFLLVSAMDVFSAKIRQLNSSVKKLVAKYSLALAFLVALVSTLGSLYFSEIVHLIPCELCWFQRICMYPQVLLFGIALLKKDGKIFCYAIPLSVIGGLIAVYNYILQLMPSSSICSAGVSCAISPFFVYSYINITIMALTGFVLITTIGLINGKQAA